MSPRISPAITSLLRISPFAIAATIIVAVLLSGGTSASAQQPTPTPTPTPVLGELPTDDPPLNFRVTGVSHDSFSVGWKVPRNRGITHYYLEQYEHDGSNFVPFRTEIEGDAGGGYTIGWSHIKLKPNTLYKDDLTLTNDAGFAIIKASVTVRTLMEPDPTDASLTGLTLRDIDFGTFDADTTSYTATVPNSVSNTAIAPTVDSRNGATFVISANGVDYPNFLVKVIRLNVGSNAIQIKVTSKDGETTKTYTVTVTRSTASGSPETTPTPTPTPTPENSPTPTLTPPPLAGTPTSTPTPISQSPTSTPTPALTPTPISQSPTNTPAPALTPTPTFIPVPTHTPVPTSTPMPTHTRAPTATPVSTEVPEEVTNRLSALEALVATLQEVIRALTSRIAALEADAANPEPTLTPTPVVPTPTPSFTPQPIADACIEAIDYDDSLDGNSLDGSWNSDCEASSPSPEGGVRYARYYTFSLSKKSEVIITLEAEVDTHLYLRAGTNNSGKQVADNDDYTTNSACPAVLGNAFDSCIVATLSAGDYMMEATTYYAGRSGDFTLELKVY